MLKGLGDKEKQRDVIPQLQKSNYCHSLSHTQNNKLTNFIMYKKLQSGYICKEKHETMWTDFLRD